MQIPLVFGRQKQDDLRVEASLIYRASKSCLRKQNKNQTNKTKPWQGLPLPRKLVGHRKSVIITKVKFQAITFS